MPDEPEAAGLLALMLMHDARRAARLDADGEIVTLEDQDRGRWDAAEISEGVPLLEAALRLGRPGPYQVQAAIAACHVTAARAADTDWGQIARLYGQLARFLPTPVVELNRAVAVGMAEGPEAGLALVAALEAEGKLTGYHLLPATKADLYRRLGRPDEAAACYREAISLASTDAERRYLSRRLAETGSQGLSAWRRKPAVRHEPEPVWLPSPLYGAVDAADIRSSVPDLPAAPLPPAIGPAAGSATAGNDINGTSMSPGQHRWDIDAVWLRPFPATLTGFSASTDT
jgi:tetratricopeptide (TPR) repeat protein